jgi:hypothetical protein
MKRLKPHYPPKGSRDTIGLRTIETGEKKTCRPGVKDFPAETAEDLVVKSPLLTKKPD